MWYARSVKCMYKRRGPAVPNTTSVRNQLSHSKSIRMPGINRSNAHARGQKHCLWGCAGLWRGLWGRSQPPVPSPDRYLAAEARTPPCPKPTVPPLRVWPRQAIERQGSGSKAPPQLGHRPWVAASCSSCTVCPLDFSVGPISAVQLGGAGLSPRRRIRTSSLNGKRPLCLF